MLNSWSNKNLIKDVADLFALKQTDLDTLEGFAEKKADNIITAIQAAKEKPLARLTAALGIHGVGEVAAEQLAANFTDLDAVAAATQEQLESIEGFGPNTAASILQWFSIERNQNIVSKLKRYGVWPTSLESEHCAAEGARWEAICCYWQHAAFHAG